MCHRSWSTFHEERRAETVSSRPRSTPQAPIRAGDGDRERVIELLRRHAAAGRLDADELATRIDRVYAATYVHEVDAALAELPPEPASERPREARAATEAWRPAAFVLAIVALVIVTSATGAWALWWLMWPLALVLGPGRYRRRWHQRSFRRAGA